MVRSCLLSLQSKPLRPCWASLSGLLGKPPMLVEQVSWNVMGKSGHSSYRGPMWKDELYLLWACGYGLIGLANGPIGPTRPYLTFYPLHYLNCIFLLTLPKNISWSRHWPYIFFFFFQKLYISYLTIKNFTRWSYWNSHKYLACFVFIFYFFI